MARLLTLLVVISSVVHSTFGCCLHHAHACDTACCRQPGPAAAGCPCGAHREASSAASGAGWHHQELVVLPGAQGEYLVSESSNGRHHCQGEPCLAVTSDGARARWTAIVSCPTASTEVGFVSIDAACGADRPASDVFLQRPVGVRRHLLLAVFLL